MERVAAVGNGDHWSTTSETQRDHRRGSPDMPFGEVVDSSADTTNLQQIAGWFRRDVASV